MAEFAGLPDAAYDILLELEGDPPPSFLAERRAAYDRLIREPLQALVDELNADNQVGTFWLNGVAQHPWAWQHPGLTAWIARRVRVSVCLDLDGMLVEGGWSGAAGDQLPRYRAAVDAEHSGLELAEIVADLRAAGFDFGEPELQRVPRDYPAEHSRAELLRRRSVFARHPVEIDPGTPKVVPHIRELVDSLAPLTAWFVDYIATAGFAAVR